MRPVHTHPEKSLKFTDFARTWCIILNTYKRFHPNCTFKEMAESFNLSETNIRRYYYSVHHKNTVGRNGEKSYTQMREGACCPLYELI
jgi:response regulator of citrate/malate metabolism